MTGQDMLSINVVAARLGLSVHQLRRWELMFGLDIKRGRGQQRQYRPEDLSVLERIRELVEQGWPTSQIRPQLEAEGLINPRLIGVPPNPGNPEMLTESIIGLRTFTERRFIELSKQIDELRQLLISVTLKQELAQDKSSPWQPVTTTTTEFTPGPSPRPMPAQEFTFGPQISIDPPSKINSPMSPVSPQSGLNLNVSRTLGGGSASSAFKEPASAQPVVKNAIIPPPNYGGEKAETAEAPEASASPSYPPLPPNPFKPVQAKPKDQEETVDLEMDDISVQTPPVAAEPEKTAADWQNLSSFSSGSSTSEIAQVATDHQQAEPVAPANADLDAAFQATQIDMPSLPESFSPEPQQEIVDDENEDEEDLDGLDEVDQQETPDLQPALAQTTPAADTPEMPKQHEPMPITPGPQVNFGPNVSAPVPQVAPQRVDDNFGLGEVTDQNYLTVLGRALDLIGWTDEQADSYSLKTFGVPHWDELGRSQAEKLVAHLIALLKEQVG